MIRILQRKKFRGIWWETGSLMSFRYIPYHADPKPTAIIINSIDGIHPTTGWRHSYFQAINLSYLPFLMRKKFARDFWHTYDKSNQKLIFTWRILSKKYPYLASFIRRYKFVPGRYIQNPKIIPVQDREAEIDKLLQGHYVSKKIRIQGARRKR